MNCLVDITLLSLAEYDFEDDEKLLDFARELTVCIHGLLTCRRYQPSYRKLVGGETMIELNKKQKTAAEFKNGIASVIAVPGSGKTLTMTVQNRKSGEQRCTPGEYIGTDIHA